MVGRGKREFLPLETSGSGADFEGDAQG